MKIILAPDSRLTRISKEVMVIDSEIENILNKMLECMYENNGIGLAAPQVGILKRLVVIDCSNNENKKKPYMFINPEIIEYAKDETEFEEGCLSLPKQFAKVSRPSYIKIKYKNIKGNLCKKNFKGLEATCIQHEIDHLNGKLFVDHVSKLKKNIIIKKLIKYKKYIND